MATNEKPVTAALIACEVCLKEVPVSEATVPEATDYVVYFCGLACYDKWKSGCGITDKDSPESSS